MINSPVFEMLKKYNEKNMCRFHMPGHKGEGLLFGGVGSDLIALDTTETDDTDNLLNPKGALYEGQLLLSRAAKSYKSFFLCGGATLGNLVMIMSSIKKGEKILVDRFCHISVFSALSLSGAVPVYINNNYAHKSGVLDAVGFEETEKAIFENLDAKAVFITSPNSFGICSPVKKIASLCKEKGMFLFVDEAHGAHFPYSPLLPESAMEQGADASVQSYHKTLPALTQSAVLHVGNADLCDKMEETLHMLMSSSPSFLLNASVDYARAYMEKAGKEKIESLVRLIDNNLPANVLRTKEYDKLRIVAICDGEKSIDILRKNKFEPEMYSEGFVVFIVTVADKEDTVLKLLNIIKTLPQNNFSFPEIPVCNKKITPAEAYNAKGERINIEDAEGRILRKPIYAYPPGVPLIAPGEMINKECIKFILNRNFEGAEGNIVEVVVNEA